MFPPLSTTTAVGLLRVALVAAAPSPLRSVALADGFPGVPAIVFILPSHLLTLRMTVVAVSAMEKSPCPPTARPRGALRRAPVAAPPSPSHPHEPSRTRVVTYPD